MMKIFLLKLNAADALPPQGSEGAACKATTALVGVGENQAKTGLLGLKITGKCDVIIITIIITAITCIMNTSRLGNTTISQATLVFQEHIALKMLLRNIERRDILDVEPVVIFTSGEALPIMIRDGKHVLWRERFLLYVLLVRFGPVIYFVH